MSIRLSYSLVKNLLEGCAWQTALERIVGLNGPSHPRAVSGTAYHAAIEQHELARKAGDDLPTPDEMIETALAVVRDEDPGWPHAMIEGSLDEATVGVINWWSAPLPKGQPGEGASMRDRIMQWTPLFIEEKLTIELDGGREYTGVIDAVYQTETGIRPVDQKSAKNFNRYPLDGKGLGQQSATYAQLLAAVMGWEVELFEYHIARVAQAPLNAKGVPNASYQRARIVQVETTDEDRAQLKDNLERAEAILQAGLFPKTKDWFLCSSTWCPFHVGAGGPCNPQGPQEFDLLPLIQTG